MYHKYDRFANPSVMIKELVWEPLIERRVMAKTITAYEILNKLITFHEEGSIPLVQQLSRYLTATQTSIRIHTFQVQQNCWTIDN